MINTTNEYQLKGINSEGQKAGCLRGFHNYKFNICSASPFYFRFK